MDIDQMLQFTQALQRMCSYGYGELTIVVKNGRPFALVEKRSIRLKKGLTADS